MHQTCREITRCSCAMHKKYLVSVASMFLVFAHRRCCVCACASLPDRRKLGCMEDAKNAGSCTRGNSSNSCTALYAWLQVRQFTPQGKTHVAHQYVVYLSTSSDRTNMSVHPSCEATRSGHSERGPPFPDGLDFVYARVLMR